ncbi:hypothetical protein [Sulfurimonas sp.]|uniref:hypothetical protein n=1 Tax=Sulfurimonas sp. TaxID=2022749 RepID=UPI003565148F
MKITKILILSITLLFITACGNRTQFKAQEPLENAALVYIYSHMQISTDDSSGRAEYNIRINNKPVMERIRDGEYMVFNLKPQPMTISATKNQIREKVLNLDLKSGQIYYLKINDSQDGSTFDFIVVKNSLGAQEIAKTGLAGSSEESQDNIITEFVNPKETDSMEVKPTVAPATAVAPIAVPQASTPVPAASAATPMSKTDEIMKAYEMKEKGIVSDEEFKALKTNILNK